MILGFKPQFVEPILHGTKIHTIRIGDRIKKGMKLQLATGVRTKNYQCFKEVICTSVQEIDLYKNMRLIKLYASRNKAIDLELLAKNDGFDNVEEFFNFFKKTFYGQIIHWSDFKY